MNAKSLGLIGAIMVGASLLLPAVSLPIVGAMNYYKTDYILPSFIIVAALGIIGAVRSSRALLLIAGAIGSVANLVFIIRVGQLVDEMRAKAGESEGLLGELGEAITNTIQIQFGVFVSVAGAVVLIIAGIMMPRKESTRSKPLLDIAGVMISRKESTRSKPFPDYVPQKRQSRE